MSGEQLSEQVSVQPTEQVAQTQYQEDSNGMLVPVENVPESNDKDPQGVADQQEQQPENIEDNNQNDDGNKDIKEETVQLDKKEYDKLKEYELIEAERTALQQRLGLQDVDPYEMNYQTVDQQIVNIGQRELLRLCNEYRVDSNPDKFRESVENLKQSNPQKGYELERRIEHLMYDVDNRRQQVAYQNSQSQVQKFANENRQLLEASPAINQILTEYATYNQGDPNIYNNLNMINQYLIAVCKEAFEAGTKYQAVEKAKSDTSKVQGGVVNAPQSGYSGEEHIFTRNELARMSDADFAKYEKKITEQYNKGLIS